MRERASASTARVEKEGRMLKNISVLGFAAALICCAAPTSVYAQEDSDQATQSQEDSSSDSSSAADQLDDAVQDGQEAVDAQTDEDAKAESNETFDTPHDSDGN
jgi:hypothetical protein